MNVAGLASLSECHRLVTLRQAWRHRSCPIGVARPRRLCGRSRKRLLPLSAPVARRRVQTSVSRLCNAPSSAPHAAMLTVCQVAQHNAPHTTEQATRRYTVQRQGTRIYRTLHGTYVVVTGQVKDLRGQFYAGSVHAVEKLRTAWHR